MGKQEDVDKLDRLVRDIEIRLHTIKMSIDSLTKEIDILAELEIQLDQNVKCLKKKNVIAIAAEFKKSKDDLARAKARSIILKNDREHFRKNSAEMDAMAKKTKEELKKLQKIGQNNVLLGKFRRKGDG